MKPSLNWLLVFVPATVLLHLFFHQAETLIFVFACVSVIPLAGWMGRATEHLAERTSEGIGGLLNATFGNAAELIIAFVAMRKGMNEIVKASLTGSIIGNIFLVLGASLVAGGIRNREQRFNAGGARIQSTLFPAGVTLRLPNVLRLESAKQRFFAKTL
ncbi:MAG: hypothetical protein O2960_16175 [Verrucomicrobia bacterium]|nr:hypothetical protein [Verrucomicrobiota bacterium]